jgi:hypothetical protein
VVSRKMSNTRGGSLEFVVGRCLPGKDGVSAEKSALEDSAAVGFKLFDLASVHLNLDKSI